MTTELDVPPRRPTGGSWAPPNKAVDGNGREHDTVQAAVDEETGIVLVGPGTFNESVSISAIEETIFGVGDASVIDGGTSGHAVEFQSGARDGTVANIKVKTSGGSGNTHDGLHISASDITVNEVTVTDSDNVGIFSDGVTTRIRSCNVELADSNGIAINDRNSIVTGCYVGETDNDITSHAVRVGGSECLVSGNQLFQPGGDCVKAVGDNTNITGNVFDTPDSNGVTLEGSNQKVSDNQYISVGLSNIDTSSATNPVIDEVFSVTDTSVSLSSGTGTASTGVSSTSAAFDISWGIQDPDADADVEVRTQWDDSDGEHDILVVEGSTSQNPTVNVVAKQVSE